MGSEEYMDIYEAGRAIPPQDIRLVADFIIAIRRDNDSLYKKGLLEGGFIRELAQRILDCALDREAVSAFFKSRGIDLYKLAGEPPPL